MNERNWTAVSIHVGKPVVTRKERNREIRPHLSLSEHIHARLPGINETLFSSLKTHKKKKTIEAPIGISTQPLKYDFRVRNRK